VPLLLAAAGQVETAKDLATVIMLQGKPCGAVTSYRKNAENKDNVVCRSGDRCRFKADKRGKVTVTKL
jgi:hypothetical protein